MEVQLAPPSVDRCTPSFPQMSTVPSPCTKTSHTLLAVVTGVGSEKAQVAPPSVVRPTPQLVPMTALPLAALMPIPNADGAATCDAGHPP